MNTERVAAPSGTWTLRECRAVISAPTGTYNERTILAARQRRDEIWAALSEDAAKDGRDPSDIGPEFFTAWVGS